MGKLNTLLKDTAVYGLSSIVGRFLNYLMVPLYTYTLNSCSDYGIYNDIYSQTGLLLVILTFGMETTFFRFVNKEEQPKEVFNTALLMVGGVALLFLSLVLGFLPQIAQALGYAETPWYLGMMAIVVSMDAIQAILYGLLRYQRRPWRFASLKLLFILLSCTLNVLAYTIIPHFMEEWEITIAYAFAINLICTSIIMLCFIPELSKNLDISAFRSEMAKRMLSYTWPMLVLGFTGILNQVAGQLMLPRVLPQEEGRHALGIYGACVKIAMIMALITQSFRFALEPLVFAGHKDKNNPELLAQSTKFFVIFTLLAFLGVMAYIDILKVLVGSDYHEGLGIVPIVMVAEIMMGVYFNLSFWYKLIDKTIYGALFSLAGCTMLILVNYIFIPKYGYMACAWGGVAGYGTAMVLSYIIGQIKNPIPYPMGSITVYAVIAALFFFLMQAVPSHWPIWTRLGINTVLLLAFVGHIIYHDIPLHKILKARR